MCVCLFKFVLYVCMCLWAVIVCTCLQTFKTQTILKTYEPVWDEEFEFQIDEAINSMNDSLKIEIYDWDRATKDDFIGEVG